MINPTFWVAFSGGLDSQVLLHFLATNKSSYPLHVIHINHHLMPEADAWADYCEKTVKKLDVPFTAVSVAIQQKPQESLEAAAREARYQAFANHMAKGDILLTAHHEDDQAETLLLQLLRGAGLAGVSAMPAIIPFAKGYLIRPLLSFSRDMLYLYAKMHHLDWIEDPSNQDTRFNRNFLRQEIFPRLKSRFPQVSKTFSRFASHCAAQESVIMTLAHQDFIACFRQYPPSLSVLGLQALDIARRQNVLRYWLRHIHKLHSPSEKNLLAIQKNLIEARQDANPVIFIENIALRRYRQYLFLCGKKTATQIFSDDKSIRENLTPDQIAWCQKHLSGVLDNKNVTFTFRQGGERFRPKGKPHTRTLKNLYQEWGIPPWERAFVPLVYDNNGNHEKNTLIAVVGFSVAEN